MKNRNITLVYLVIASIFIFNSFCYSQKLDVAVGFIEKLDKGEFELIQNQYLDKKLQSLLDTTKLHNIWDSLEKRYGEFEAIEKNQLFAKKVVLYCNFNSYQVDIEISFDTDNYINGFHIISELKKLKYQYPTYLLEDSISQEPIKFAGYLGELNGTLTYPKKKVMAPLIIFIHGSGPQDQDESIGPNKPFKDIALGLAKYKVASFRYDKSSYEYPNKIDSIERLTVNEEIIYDCVKAIDFIETNNFIKFSKIFLLGHSLGATIAPEVALRKKVDGLILISATAKSLPNILKNQLSYLEQLPDSLRESGEVINLMRNEITKLNDINNLADTLKILGARKYYWNDLNKYNVINTVKQFKIPILFVQGMRDYQVDQSNFEILKKKLSSKKNVSFKSYDDLNHFLIEGKGPSSPKEYNKIGNVRENVIEDISNWIFLH